MPGSTGLLPYPYKVPMQTFIPVPMFLLAKAERANVCKTFQAEHAEELGRLLPKRARLLHKCQGSGSFTFAVFLPVFCACILRLSLKTKDTTKLAS